MFTDEMCKVNKSVETIATFTVLSIDIRNYNLTLVNI